jgi:DNA primase
MLARKTIEQVKAYSDIVAIISEFVALSKKGRNYLGLCPFHQEKTPSFTVSPEKGIWHCFGCHASGDHISFIMQIDNLTFTEAISYIAEKVGIDVEREENSTYNSPYEKDKHEILEVLFKARELYAKMLTESPKTKSYISERGINEDSIKDFYLGFADSNINIWEYMLAKGFAPPILKKSGLFAESSSGNAVPRFRDRLIFPIIDYRGRTVGFGGRVLDGQTKMAKYLNSEETPIFNKRKLLYGLSAAKPTIKEKDAVMIMEGYMDVITAHQYGFKNSCAVMGTAISVDHAQKIKRFTNNVYLVMDQDEAGQKSCEKSFEVLRQYNMKVNVVQYQGKDPAEVLTDKGASYFQDCIDKAIPMIEFKFNRACERYNTKKIDNIPDVLREIIPILKSEPEMILKRHYIRVISQKLNIDEELLMAKIRKSSYNISQKIFLTKKIKNKYRKAEEHIVYLMASCLKLRQQIKDTLTTKDFISPELVSLFKVISSLSKETNQDILEHIQEPEIRSLFTSILIEGEKFNQDNNWQTYHTLLKEYKNEEKAVVLKNKIKESETNGQEDQANILLMELSELRKEIG